MPLYDEVNPKMASAPMLINGRLHKRRKGVPQGSPLSPLLSNIILDELDKELARKGLRYVRYADDFSIYTKSKAEARQIGNEIFIYLRDKLRLPINRTKSGIRRPNNFELLGHGFVPIYKKGVKGQYQLVAKKGSWESLKRKLKRITKKTKPYNFEERLQKLLEVCRGWVNNYRLVHVEERWVICYVRRWLEAPIHLENGTIKEKEGKGTPQGGVISPLLSNLYLHYVLDKWMAIKHPAVPLVRYSDDVIIHCNHQKEAEQLMREVKARLQACNLTAHPGKTRLVHCQNYKRHDQYPIKKFDFLGFSFKPQIVKLKNGKQFLGFDCIMSRKSKKRINGVLKRTKIFRNTTVGIQEIARNLNPKTRGWIQYYGKISKRSLHTVFYYLHQRTLKWIMKKYKKFRNSRVKAVAWLRRVVRDYPYMFYHWQLGYKLV